MRLHDHPYPLLQWAVVLGVCTAAAITDARTRRIPNALTGPFFLIGLLVALALTGPPGLAEASAAGVLLALPYVLLFLFGGGGAGDAKLMAGVGAWLGLVQGALALGCVAGAGVVLALVAARHRGRLSAVLQSIGDFARAGVLAVAGPLRARDVAAALPPQDDAQKIPYGIAILTGVALAATGALWWPIR